MKVFKLFLVWRIPQERLPMYFPHQDQLFYLHLCFRLNPRLDSIFHDELLHFCSQTKRFITHVACVVYSILLVLFSMFWHPNQLPRMFRSLEIVVTVNIQIHVFTFNNPYLHNYKCIVISKRNWMGDNLSRGSFLPQVPRLMD